MKAKTWMSATLLTIAATGSAQSEHKIETELTLDFESKYVWHGLNLVNDPVFQPQIAFASGNLSLILWGNVELTNWNAPNYPRGPKGRVTEIDTSIEYAGKWKETDWHAGVIDYQYPGTGLERYQEWYGAAAWAEIWGSPELSLHTGNNNHSGTYATFGVSHSVPFKPVQGTIDLSLEVTYADSRSNRFLYGYDKAGFSDALISAGTGIDLGKGWSFSPTLYYSTLLTSGILKGEPRRSNVWVSCSFGVKF